MIKTKPEPLELLKCIEMISLVFYGVSEMIQKGIVDQFLKQILHSNQQYQHSIHSINN